MCAEAFDAVVSVNPQLLGMLMDKRAEADVVPGFKLAHLPALGFKLNRFAGVSKAGVAGGILGGAKER